VGSIRGPGLVTGRECERSGIRSGAGGAVSEAVSGAASGLNLPLKIRSTVKPLTAHHFNNIERSLVNETKHLTPTLAVVFALLGNAAAQRKVWCSDGQIQIMI